jgi:hypothetical protein
MGALGWSHSDDEFPSFTQSCLGSMVHDHCSGSSARCDVTFHEVELSQGLRDCVVG